MTQEEVSSTGRRQRPFPRCLPAPLGTAGTWAFDGRAAPTANQTCKDWLAGWEKRILNDARNRYCDREMGEEIGWLVSPFLTAFTTATRPPTRASGSICLSIGPTPDPRGVKEPDGYIGWPKADGASTGVMPGLYTDNVLGEALGLRPVVLMADTILKTPALRQNTGGRPRSTSAWPSRFSRSGTGGAAGAR